MISLCKSLKRIGPQNGRLFGIKVQGLGCRFRFARFR